MGSQLALKSRIASTASLEKIFNAQEMIASSHIAKARDVALNAKPYTDAIFDAVQTALRNNLDLQAKRKELAIANADIKKNSMTKP